MEPPRGFEPRTLGLRYLCSTTELRRLVCCSAGGKNVFGALLWPFSGRGARHFLDGDRGGVFLRLGWIYAGLDRSHLVVPQCPHEKAV